jgi:hypothetical protein
MNIIDWDTTTLASSEHRAHIAHAAYHFNEMLQKEKHLTFLENLSGDVYHLQFSVHTKTSLISFTQRIQRRLSELATDFRIQSFTDFSLLENADLLCIVSDQSFVADAWTETDRVLNVLYCGRLSHIEAVRDQENLFSDAHSPPIVQWHYAQKDYTRSANLTIAPPKTIHNEFYPFLNQSVDSYIDDYMASDNDVLVLLGETGTGKTSLIRHMIWRHRLRTSFTFDEKLLQADEFFATFISDSKTRLLVVEDADLMLTSRERDGNNLMAKFLNLGDGLMKGNLPKKIVFVANLMDAGRIDPALLRPGRCFACTQFRPLSYKEANAAAEMAGLSKPKLAKEYTLAELFATTTGVKIQSSRVGFVN